MRRLGIMAPALLVLLLPGCGDGLKRVPVYGKATAKGKPIDNVFILFVPMGSTKGEGGYGVTDSDGNYSLISTRTDWKGVPPGEYKVRLSRLVGPDGTALPPSTKTVDNPGARESIPKKYLFPDTSPLRFVVPESGGEIHIEIPEGLQTR